MAYHFTGSSSEYVEFFGNQPLDPLSSSSESTPLYVCMWIRLTETLGGGRTAFYFGQSSSSSKYLIMYAQADGTVRVHDRTGARETAASTIDLNDFLWHHISFALEDVVTNHLVSCWVDNDTPNTASGSGQAGFDLYDQVSIGALRRSSPTGYITADIADVAMVNTSPTFAQRAQLLAGWSVRSVFAESQIWANWRLEDKTDVAVANSVHDSMYRQFIMETVGGTPNRVPGPYNNRLIQPVRNNVGTSIAVLGAAPPATRNRAMVCS